MGPQKSTHSMARMVHSFARSVKACLTRRGPCGGWRTRWSARTAWAPSWRHSAPTAGNHPNLALTPCWPPCKTAWRTVSVFGPDSSAVPAAQHLPRLIPLLLSRALEIKSGEFQTALQHCLGLAILPLNAPTVQCGCGATLHRVDRLRHAMLRPCHTFQAAP
jgi:hypothetical protein